MESNEAKKRILEATMKLLLKHKNENKVTVREIAQEAGVNGAMINYYFQSKNNLLNMATGTCMEQMAKVMLEEDKHGSLPILRLKRMLKALSTFAFENYFLSSIAISSDLKNGSVITSQMLLPLLREIFTEEKTETELRLISIQLILPLQIIFLNPKAYSQYFESDIYDEAKRNMVLEQLADNLTRR